MYEFHVGQVVVCVNADGLGGYAVIGEVPREGGVYTIRAVCKRQNQVALMLAEIVNEEHEWSDGNIGEVAFLASRFRPAKTTSLEVFEKALAPAPVRNPEVVT